MIARVVRDRDGCDGSHRKRRGADGAGGRSTPAQTSVRHGSRGRGGGTAGVPGYDAFVNVQGDEPFLGAERRAGRGGRWRTGGSARGRRRADARARQCSPVRHRKGGVRDHGRALYFRARRSRFCATRTTGDARHSGAAAHRASTPTRASRAGPLGGAAAHPLELVERLEQLRPWRRPGDGCRA